MTDFTKILDKAKELEAKMKESQEKIKEIKAEGVSGSNSVKITLDGEGEMQKIELSDEIASQVNHFRQTTLLLGLIAIISPNNLAMQSSDRVLQYRRN